MKHTLLCAAAIVAACASARPPPAGGERIDPVTVDLLTKAQFFGAADAAPVVPAPGRYRVEAAGPRTLRLVPAEGKPVELPAVEATHSEPIEAPVAFTFQSDEDTEQVVLRLPGGKALHAIGSYSGSRPRGDVIVKTAPFAEPEPDIPPGCLSVEIAGVDFTVDQFGASWGAVSRSWFGAYSNRKRTSATSLLGCEELVSGTSLLPIGASLRAIEVFWYDSDPYFDVRLSITDSWPGSAFMPVTTVLSASSQGSAGYGKTRVVLPQLSYVSKGYSRLLTISVLLPPGYGSYTTSLRSVRLYYTGGQS